MSKFTLGIKQKLEVIAPQSNLRAVALLRVRNEELILRDTLEELSTIVDGVVAFDDASEDSTLEILRAHPAVIAIVINNHWEKEATARLQAETSHRQTLLDVAKHYFNPKWLLCCDADERYFGEIRKFFDNEKNEAEPQGVRIQLFDAYLTEKDQEPLILGQKLRDSRIYFGKERRDILMIFKNSPGVRFEGLDAREPVVSGQIKTLFYCQHFGKAISVAQWEVTCDYYINHFPWDSYGKKWTARRGRAIHKFSDFNTRLYKWGPSLFKNAVQIHPDDHRQHTRGLLQTISSIPQHLIRFLPRINKKGY
jgi:glycosyltransferase involved in cell wall biosynthesis